jgi:hypothetical protein
MSEILSLLIAAQNNDDVSKALDMLDAPTISSLDDDTAKRIQESCASISTNETLANAKLRRRLKRAQESIDGRSDIEERVAQKENQASASIHSSTNYINSQDSSQSYQQRGSYVSSSSNNKQPVASIAPTSMPEASSLLHSATDTRQIEAVLNSLILPSKDATTGNHSKEFIENRETLLSALNYAETLLIKSGASRITRRRLQRLQFTLQDDKNKEKIKLEKKASIEANHALAAQIVEKAKTLPEASKATVDALNNAITVTSGTGKDLNATNIDTAMVKLQESGLPCVFTEENNKTCAHLIAVLDKLSAEEGEGSTLSARERRRVKRVLTSLNESKDASIALFTPQKSASASAVSSSSSSSAAASVSVSFTESLATFQALVDATETDSAALLASLVTMPAPADIDATSDEGQQFKVLLSKAQDLTVTAPVKRRVQRALAALEKQTDPTPVHVAASATDNDQEKSKMDVQAHQEQETVLMHNPPVGPPLEPNIEAVKAATTAEELDTALEGVRSSSGNNKSRRTLKRALAAATAESTPLYALLNSKQRRNVTRVIAALEGKANTGAKEVPVEMAPSRKRDNNGEDTENDWKRKKGGPYVLFVGQLPYSASSEDVEELFKRHGLSEPTGHESDPTAPLLKVRMLTDTDGNSKGSAFIEVQSAEHLHRALGLHHTVLNGRRINVEKSCGGRNKDVRDNRLAEQRTEQEAAVREKTNETVDSFQSKGLPSRIDLGTFLMDRLYKLPVHDVTTILEKYIGINGVKSAMQLDRLLNEHETKAARIKVVHAGMAATEEEQDMDVLPDM